MTQRRNVVLAAVAVVAFLLLTGCSLPTAGHGTTSTPRAGVCRQLTADDVTKADNDSPIVACTDAHTAQTYAAGALPSRYEHASLDDQALATWAYGRCNTALSAYLGTDLSTQMRSLLTWVWFRPSSSEWADGARWYRCDVLDGGQNGVPLSPLPVTAKNLLAQTDDDAYMICGEGDSVAGSTKVACTQPHDWRAVSTIKVGEPADPYPGDSTVLSKTKAYCNESVAAWLGYPTTLDYGYTWYGAAEWKSGNRRSVCWAKTTT